MQFDSRQLAALSAILRLGSFEAAAGALGITQSAVSQRLKALEEQVGSVLVLRESPCRGTEAGSRLAAHAEAVALMEAQVSRDLGREDAAAAGPVRLRLAVNADSLATWFAPALKGIGGVVYDLVVDNESHSTDWLRRGEVMAAVTEHARPVQGCDVHPLGQLRYVAAATPAFIDQWFAEGITREALARAPIVQFNEKDDLQQQWIERQTGKRAAPPAHLVPSAQAHVAAVQLGIGWGMVPTAMVWRQLRRGHLQTLVKGTALDTPLYWQVSRMLAPVLEPLTSAVIGAAQDGLKQEAEDDE